MDERDRKVCKCTRERRVDYAGEEWARGIRQTKREERQRRISDSG